MDLTLPVEMGGDHINRRGGLREGRGGEDHDELDEATADRRGPFAGLGRRDRLQVFRLKDIVAATKRSSPPPVKGKLKGPAELAPSPSLVFAASPEAKGDPEIDPEPLCRLELRFYDADAEVIDGLGGPPVDFVEYLRATLRSGGFRALQARNTPREARQLAALGERAT